MKLTIASKGKVLSTMEVTPFTSKEELLKAATHASGSCDIWEYYEHKGSMHSFRNIHTGEKQHTSKEIPVMQYGTLVTLEFIES